MPNQTIKRVWLKFKNGLMQMLSANVLNKVVSMLINMIITRVLSVDQYGSWSYVLNLYTYFTLISAFGLLNGAFQYGAENRNTPKEFAYYRYCLKKGLLINLLLVIIGLGVIQFSNLSLPSVKIYLMAYIPILLLDYVMNILLTILRCENRIKEYARILNINTVTIALGTCVGALWGVGGIVVGKYFASFTTLFVLFSVMHCEITQVKSADNQFPNKEIKELWHFSVMACVSSAMNSLLYLLDVSMVASLMKSAELTGIYKVATLAPNALSFIPASVVVVILPNIIANNNDKRWLRIHVKKYYLYMGITNAFIDITAIVMAPLIISVLSGTNYLAAVPAFRLLLVGYAISSTFRTLSSNILFGLKKININMINSLVSGLLDVVLNYFLIGSYGMMGAAAATVISESVASIIAFSYAYREIYV